MHRRAQSPSQYYGIVGWGLRPWWESDSPKIHCYELLQANWRKKFSVKLTTSGGRWLEGGSNAIAPVGAINKDLRGLFALRVAPQRSPCGGGPGHMVSHRGGWCSRVLGLRSPFYLSLKLCHSSR